MAVEATARFARENRAAHAKLRLSQMSQPALERTRAALAVGFERGWHVGVQLAVWRASERLVALAEGAARPGVAMSPESLIPWFSATKLVTATAVLQLCDRGRLDLDQPVASVLPAFAASGKAAITVRHVLTHTGGFRYLAGSDDLYVRGLDYPQLVEAVNAAPIEPGWVPGERAGYHPVTGFHALGEVVRVVDGRAFDAYAAEEIFEPLGMADAWVALTPERVEAYGGRMVQMHDTSGPAPQVVSRYERADGWSWVLPSSSGVGPATDLVRLVEALRQGGALEGERILSPAAVAAMVGRERAGMTDETFGFVMDWGLGVMLNSWQYRSSPTPYGYGDHAGAAAFGHGGSQSSLAFADPEHELSVVLACNGMPGEAANHRRTQPVITALYEDLALSRRA